MNHPRGRRQDPVVRAPRRAWVAIALVLAACSQGPGAPVATPSSAPIATQRSTAAAPTAGAGVGGVSISSILGGNHAAPASTTWIRASDPAAAFSFEVPSTWVGHLAYPLSQGGSLGTVLIAGPDPTKLGTDFGIPAVAIGISANAAGTTARSLVEADTTFAGKCDAGEIQDATEGGATAAYRLWEHCGGGAGFVLLLAIVPADGQGLIEIIFQGATEADLGYLDHIVASIRPDSVQPTPGPAASAPGSVSGPTYTISMDVCQNQHGQGVSGGLIRNDDTRVHTFRIVVAFSDPNGVFLNDTAWKTTDLQPGVTAQWQATVPSGLPAVSVTCQITAVELVN